jgi:SAM-dependent methyltransferase
MRPLASRLGAGLLAGALSLVPPLAAGDLAIRNVTRSTVRFRLLAFPSAEGANRALAPGAILRLPGGEAWDLSFRSGDRVREYRLDPGASYAFRYDHADAVDLFLGSHGREDAPDLAPYVTTPMPVVRRMLELAGVARDDRIYDLGCGDGRIVVEAAVRHGARGVGVDLDPQRIQESRLLARQKGVERLVEFRVEDATTTDLSGATVVTLYLLPESNALLRPILERRLAPGTRVVSHNYEVPGWTPTGEETLRDASDTLHYLFLYVVGPPAGPGG